MTAIEMFRINGFDKYVRETLISFKRKSKDHYDVIEFWLNEKIVTMRFKNGEYDDTGGMTPEILKAIVQQELELGWL